MRLVNSSMKKLGIDQLGADERLDLLEAIWESLDAEALPIPEFQRAELQARLEEHRANPGDVLSWEEVKQSLRKSRVDK